MNQEIATMSLRQTGKVSVIGIAGELNSFAENKLMDAYNLACQQGARVILLDFRNLSFMNSSGIGLLVTLLIRARRQDIRLAAFGLNEHYRQIFELTRLNEAITVHESEEDALADLKVAG